MRGCRSAAALQALLERLPSRRRSLAFVVLTAALTVSVTAQSLPRLLAERGADQRAQEVGDAVRAEGGVPGPIASNGFWQRTAVISFQLNRQFYGQPRQYEMDEGLADHLDLWGIQTFIAWGEPLESPPGPEVTPEQLEDVHIYSVSPSSG